MHRKIIIGILLILAIFTFSSLVSATSITSTEVSDAEIANGLKIGAGSDYPLYSPIESNYVWVTSVEPVKVKWTIYDPGLHQVTVIEKKPAIKYQEIGKWYVADRSVFTLPAFAQVGTWLATCEFILADGTSFSGISAENPNVIYLGIPCSDSGGILENIFVYPWYFLGMKMPAYFWIPGFILWVPLVYIGVCMVFSRSIGGFVDMTRATIKAAKEARGKKKRKRKPLLK